MLLATIALSGVVYFLSSTLEPAICAHVVCGAGGVSPLFAASLVLVLGLFLGLVTDYTSPLTFKTVSKVCRSSETTLTPCSWRACVRRLATSWRVSP
jgi:hypothetical protein